jgi:hypothetical protein
MDDLLQKLLLAIVGGGIGIFGTIWTARVREAKSSKREQLQNFYAPMEILLRMNEKAFHRYMANNATPFDREYIETNIWHPNHLKIKDLIMGQSHHLAHMPEEILDLLEHINVWLSEYELVHVRKAKAGPVFAGTRGKPHPKASDAFVYTTAESLRKSLNEG